MPQQDIAQRIYEYIYDNWVAPYPVVDDILVENRVPRPFPLFGNLTQLLSVIQVQDRSGRSLNIILRIYTNLYFFLLLIAMPKSINFYHALFSGMHNAYI